MTLPTEASPGEAVTDDTLVLAAGNGDAAAFEELYRRHHVVATRVAGRVTGNEDDARDAVAEAFIKVLAAVSSRRLRQRSSFRSYLLTTVRRVAIDKVRQRRRVESTEEVAALDGISPRQGPADAVIRSEEDRLLLEAFKDLPQRSQSVLWLVDVERVSAQEAATALGLTPNNVTQIAVRARGRLRHSYMRAHVGRVVDGRCRFAVDHMGSYLEGRLRPASLAKVDGHLDECPACEARLDQLRSVGMVTRGGIVPILLLRRLFEGVRRPRRDQGPGAVAPEALAGQRSALTTHLVSMASNPTVVDVVQGLGHSAVAQRVAAVVAAGTMTIVASSLAYRTQGGLADASKPAASGAVEVAAPFGSSQEPAAAVQPPGGAGLSSPAGTAERPVAAGASASASSPPPASDTALVGTLQSLSNALAGAPDPVVVAPAGGGEVDSLPPVSVPPVTTPTSIPPPLGIPPLEASPLTTPLPGTPPLTAPLSTPESSTPPLPPAPPVSDPPLAAPALSPPPLPASLPAAPLPTPHSLTASPLTVPPLTAPPPTTPPLTMDPLTTPPLPVPPLTPPPLTTPPLTTPPVTIPLSTPPLTTPPVSTAPVSTPPLSTPPLTRPPLSTPPVSTPPLSTPPASTPAVSTPPLSTPSATTPPLSTPPLTIPTDGGPLLDAPPVSTPPVTRQSLGLFS